MPEEYNAAVNRETTFGRVVLQLSALVVAALGTGFAVNGSALGGLVVWALGAWMFLSVAPNLRTRLRGVRNAL